MNVFSFSGNLGGDCEVKSVSGTTLCKFSVAVKSGYGDKAQTIWLACDIWGKQAEGKLPDYLKKGQQVVVSGELSSREHEGKTYLGVRVNSIDLVGGKSEGTSQAPAPRPQQTPEPSGGGKLDDDIPFSRLHPLQII